MSTKTAFSHENISSSSAFACSLFPTACVFCSKIVLLAFPHAHTLGKLIEEKPRDFTLKGKNKSDENKHSPLSPSDDCVANLWFVCLIFVSLSTSCSAFQLNCEPSSKFPPKVFFLNHSKVEKSRSRFREESDRWSFSKLARLPHSGYHSMTLCRRFVVKIKKKIL